ncbi:hypothetical protein FRC12_004853 [Ceratobasidium sp. 428]|nr:hypothetical protein FRC12_004853 [Ceratobasidium sp. 428]
MTAKHQRSIGIDSGSPHTVVQSRARNFELCVESAYPVREPLGAYEAFEEDGQNESLELSTDAGVEERGHSAIPNTGLKVSSEMEEMVVEEPSKKRL